MVCREMTHVSDVYTVNSVADCPFRVVVYGREKPGWSMKLQKSVTACRHPKAADLCEDLEVDWPPTGCPLITRGPFHAQAGVHAVDHAAAVVRAGGK